MKEELSEMLEKNGHKFHDLLIQDIQHIERYPVDDEYKTIIIQSANAIKKIDSSNNHIYSTERIYGIGPNCKAWVGKKFGINCLIPEKEYSSTGLIDKIESDNYDLGKTLLLKGIGGKNTLKDYLHNKNKDYKVCDVYERKLNKENLELVSKMTQKVCVVIGFSRSSVEPLIQKPDICLKKVHFFVLDKSDENIVDGEDVASTTKIEDIYDMRELALKIDQINE